MTGVDRSLGNQDLLRWSEALAGIARTGLGFTESQYERERFEEVLAVAADIRHAAGSDLDATGLVDEWMKSVGEKIGRNRPRLRMSVQS